MKKKIKVKIEVSTRHVHLSEEHFMMLFGLHRELHRAEDLSETGSFRAAERVDIKNDSGQIIKNVRIIGPLRRETKVVISLTDSIYLKMKVPVRDKKNLLGTPGITLVGPYGGIKIRRDVIVAERHVHMSEADAKKWRLANGDFVSVSAGGDRAVIFQKVIVYVKNNCQLMVHLDTDEGNAAGIIDRATGELEFISKIHSGSKYA